MSKNDIDVNQWYSWQALLDKIINSELKELDFIVKKYSVLNNGGFWLRSISVDGINFGFVENEGLSGNVIVWSRIGEANEILCALNRSRNEQAVIYVTIDNDLHPLGSRLRCLYASSSCPDELNVESRNGKAVRLTIPPCALIIYG